MNSPIVRWLLDLDTIPPDAEALSLVWERPWPAWVWVLFVAAAAALALWSYSRLAGSRRRRAVLAGIRFVLLMLALVIISGPMIELPRESVEPDWVLVLADRSASMTIADVDRNGRRITRDDQLADALEKHASTFNALAERRELHWLGFHSSAFALSSSPDATVESIDESNPPVPMLPVDLGEASGERTNLDTAIRQALQRAAARPVSGIVVLSDGRTNDPPSRSLLRRLQAEKIPVFTHPLGSPEPLGDLALKRVDAPGRAFIRDKVPVVVAIDRFGSAVRSLGGTVRLIDELTGETLAEEQIAPGDERSEVTLTAEPELEGKANWRVVIETPEPDLIPENNSKSFAIELVDRPLRVLYVDGYPRWEYRYVKNLLVREASIESSVMLLSADRDFAQEGNQPITRMPRSPEELARYDVVILGDVPGTFFSPDQLEIMRSHVADRGAGLLWIAGPRSTPRKFSGTVLADLLPMRGAANVDAIGEPVTMRPTDLAERLGVMRIVTAEGVGWPEELLDPGYGWSQLWYAQRIEPGRLKPTAEVLAETAAPIDGDRLPLVMHIRYGAGQSIYVATDEIWRWRYGRGEMLPEQFWIQMIRMLGRESLSTAGQRAVLTLAPERVEANQPVRIELRLLDARLVDAQRETVTAVLESLDRERLADLELRLLPGSENRYAATYLPDRVGAIRVRLEDPLFADVDLTGTIEVYAPDDELRRPETDHDLLARLASETGGRVLTDDELDLLAEPGVLPNRSIRTPNPLRERIWDTPLAFALVLLVLTAEWVGRRLLRLV
jgi:uncharacterized membrane protein